MLPGFLGRYPEVRVVLTIDNRVIDLLTDGYDIAIRIGPLPDSDLIARRLTSFKLLPCANPAYLARSSAFVKKADLSAHKVIAHIECRKIWSLRRCGRGCARC